MSMIRLNNVSKFYQNKKNISSGFNKINLELEMGEFVVITGESGSGKSTLLNVISGLDSYEEGEMYINGEETSHYTEQDYENYRRKYIGNIFQHFNLINSYTVYQNIELVLLLNGYKKQDIKDQVLDIIKTVGLERFKNTKASKLSGGQKQRVAIARALAKDTPIIVADEPTGNLDVKSARAIMKLLSEISSTKLVVIVTHNYEQVSEYTTRKITMSDGRIIEDKRIKQVKEIKAEPLKPGNITVLNKIRIGLRNVFNIKSKFILLLAVYFFLTFLVFSVYSSLESQKFNEGLAGNNYLFLENSPERLIINKPDKSAFTDEEIEQIKNIDNIKSVEKEDLLLDLQTSITDDELYLFGKVKRIETITEVDEGTIPKDLANGIVISGNKNSYQFSASQDRLIGRTLKLIDSYTGESLTNVVISGIIYENTENVHFDNFTIYLPNEIIDKLKVSFGVNYSEIEMKINNKIYSQIGSSLYFQVEPNKNVKDGQAYAFEGLNSYCSYYYCRGKNLKLSVKNIYYEDTASFRISKMLNKDNFRSATGLKNFENHPNKIFISENDYNRLYNHGHFQISAFIDDLHNDKETVETIKKLGYNTFYMKEALSNENELLGVMRIIRYVVFIIATIALFFISYFIIKIILKSRNVYYSTIRILGSTKKQAAELLSIELVADVNLAYLIFMILILLNTLNVIKVEYIQNLISYFSLKDYLLIYVILVFMSLLISTRYAHKLFKDSVMSTYREEV